MNFKNIFGAIAIAAAGMFATATPSNAALTAIFDAEANGVFVPPIPVLTLDASAVGTAAFDTTSSRFNFVGGGDDNSTINMVAAQPIIFSVGNLVTGDDFTTAEVNINGTILDLKANPDIEVAVAVAGAFSIVTNFVSAAGKSGTFDFTVGTIPLPAGLALLLGGLGSLVLVGRRRTAAA